MHIIKYFSLVATCLLGLLIVSSLSTVKKYPVKDKNYDLKTDTLGFNDGPYIFINNDSLVEMSIINGHVETKSHDLDYKKIQFKEENAIYNKVNKIAALSDLHGQYDLTIKILINNGIINKNLEWTFGTGHFVIVGDIFDRGDHVTELLWFVYNLEKQALNNGGKVHYLLGNHEFMVMQNDLRYINKKYKTTEQLLKTPYNQLYGEQTVLGRWLRSKPTVLKLNDNIFVHGGLSQAFIDYGFNLKSTNHMMQQSLNEPVNRTQWDSIYGKYHDSHGPIWYRGYFNNQLKNRDVNKLLKALDAKHIIVGHTSQTKIESLYRNKVLAVDTSIKNGAYGEILLIENDTFFKGSLDGKKTKLD